MSRRYVRQTLLPEIGEAGQASIASTSVLCVGAGGLGSPVLQYLAAAGIGRIGIIDPDRVEESNLQRQVLFGNSDIGKPKATMAARRLRKLNPEMKILALVKRLGADNALSILRNYDIIVDGTDNFATKFLINDAAVKLGLPVVYGAISGFEGQVCLFWAKHGPCYRCLYPSIPKSYIPNCAENGVLGTVAGIIGSLQASEVLQWAADHGHGRPRVGGKLLLMDTRNLGIQSLHVPRRPDCPVCSIPPEDIFMPKPTVAMSCQIEKPVCYIDVRESEEWRESRIPGSINWPLSLIQAGQLPQLDPDTYGVVYCQSGYRSKDSLRIFRSNGFGNFVELSGGLDAWEGPRELGKVCKTDHRLSKAESSSVKSRKEERV